MDRLQKISEFSAGVMGYMVMVSNPAFLQALSTPDHPHHEFAERAAKLIEDTIPAMVTLYQEGHQRFGPSIEEVNPQDLMGLFQQQLDGGA